MKRHRWKIALVGGSVLIALFLALRAVNTPVKPVSVGMAKKPEVASWSADPVVASTAAPARGAKTALVAPPVAVATPLIGRYYPNDRDGDAVDDQLMQKARRALTARAAAQAMPGKPGAQTSADEWVEVELIFATQVTQEQIYRYQALGGEISYLYKAVSFGWNGRIPLGNVIALAASMGSSLRLIQEPRPMHLEMDKATATGRVRPIWQPGFAGKAAGFEGAPSITIAIVDSGVDETHDDLVGRRVYWRDFSTDAADTPTDVEGHGSHVAGVATGSGVAGGSEPATLKFTQTWNYKNEAGELLTQLEDFRRSPMELPPIPVTVTFTATWEGDSTTSLGCMYAEKGSDDYAPEGTLVSGPSPLTYTQTFTPQIGRVYSPALKSNGTIGHFAVQCQVSDYPGVGDGLAKMRGVAPGARWAAAKVATDAGETRTNWICAAIDDLVANRAALNIKVINLSMGLPGVDAGLRQKINSAVNAGIVVAAAAGNGGGTGYREVDEPGRAAMALTVAANNDVNQLTNYSSGGFASPGSAAGQEEDHKPDLMAPGGSSSYSDILSVDSNSADGLFADQQSNDYAPKRGTSMASPFAAGCAALVIDALQQTGVTWDFNSSQHARYVKMVLCATASESNQGRENNLDNPTLQRNQGGPDGFPTGKDPQEGYGNINPDAAVEAVSLTYKPGTTTSETLGPSDTSRRVWARSAALVAGQSIAPVLTVPDGGDYDLYLYSSTPSAFGTPLLLASSTTAGNGGTESFTYTPAAAGAALLVVKRVAGSGAFTLQSSGGSAGGPAPDASTLTNGGPATASISSPTDVDWFKIDVAAPGTLVVNLTVPSGKDYDIELYGGESPVLLTGSYNGAGSAESIIYNAATAGTYYVRVYGYPAGNGSYSTSADYIITSNFSASGPVGISPATKAIDASSQTYPIAVTATGNWSVTEDLSWVQVFPANGTGNGSVEVTVAVNPAATARTGLINIGGRIHALAQAGTDFQDLEHWTLRSPLPQANQLSAVAWGMGRFVAVGRNGTILTSPDGIAWTVRDSGTSGRLEGLASNGQLFVAVGENGTILTSSNGAVWTAQDSHTTLWLNGVAWNGSLFIAVGYGGGLLSSPDGVTWTAQASGSVSDLKGVTWNGSRFVAVGGRGAIGAIGVLDGTILSSADGLTWETAYTNTMTPLSGVAWGNHQFVVVGQGGTVLTSPDGMTWTMQAAQTAKHFSSVAWNGQLFVAVENYDASGQIAVSPDGNTWTIRSSGANCIQTGVTWNGSVFVAVGARGSIITSPDGLTWLTQAAGATKLLKRMAWNGRLLVAVGEAGLIQTSPDGVTWTTENTGTTSTLFDVVWDGGQFIAAGSGILTSPDGITWTVRSAVTVFSLTGLAWNGNLLVAVGFGGKIMTSPDGITWTTRNSGTTNDFKDVTWGGGQFVAVGGYSRIVTSTDGVNWTIRDSGAAGWDGLNSVAWNGSLFVAVGNNAEILTSPDGVVWTFQAWSFGERNNLTAVNWSGQQFVAVGQSGTIRTSPDGVAWSGRSPVGETHVLPYFADVAWIGGQFVAIGWDPEGTNMLLTLSATEGLVLAPDEWTVPASGGSYPVYVTASSSWAVSAAPDWANVSPPTGTSNSVVTVNVGANPSPEIRTAAIVIGGQSHILHQAGYIAAPTITTQPLSQTVLTEDSVTFTVVATGGSSLSYQWRKDGVNLAAATGATLTLNNVLVNHAGAYSVIVSNPGGVVASAPAMLTVHVAHPGTPVAWGSDAAGQTDVPSDLAGVIAVAAGGNHSVALKSDGTVVAWGYNQYGQTNVPAELTGVIAIAAGPRHTLALKQDGTVVAWGYNQYGQANVPANLGGVIAIVAAASFYGGQSVALKSNGTVVAWGDNGYAALNVPADLNGVIAIAAGGQDGYGFGTFTLALKSDGTVTAWGSGQFGQEWNPNGQTSVPAGLSGVRAITAGNRHSVALKADGTVVAWGSNYDGESSVPSDLAGVIAIAAGGYHTIALKSDGTLVAWGRNTDGQTGVPTGLSGVTAIAAGLSHTLALVGTGAVAELAPASQIVPAAGGTYTLNVNASGNWTVYESLGWVSVTPQNGSGNGTVTVTVDANPDTNARDGRITVSGRQHLVSQHGLSLHAPEISSQPHAQVVSSGQTVTFTIVAAGTPAPAYQWLKNGNTIPGAINPTLTIGNAQPSDAGTYEVKVSNSVGTIMSSAILLVVDPCNLAIAQIGAGSVSASPSGITSGLGVQTYSSGTQVYITVDAPPGNCIQGIELSPSGSLPPDIFIQYVTLASLSAHPGSSGLGTHFAAPIVVDQDKAITVTFALDPLTAVAPTISAHPADQIVRVSQIASYTVVAAGTPTPTFQWQRQAVGAVGFVNLSNDRTYAGVTTATLYVQVTTREMSGDEFRCLVSNGVNPDAESNAATLTVSPDFDLWRLNKFSTDEQLDPNLSGPNAIYGHDGLPNLVKYALGLEPKQDVTTGLPVVGILGNDWTYIFTKPDSVTDVACTIEFSTDLTNWNSTEVTVELVSSLNGSGTWRGRVPLTAGANVFFRLRVNLL